MKPETAEPTAPANDAPAPQTDASRSPNALEARAGARARRLGSVRLWLASLVVACVLPVWIAAGFLVFYNYQSRRMLTEQRMLETARALSSVVDRELANIEGGLSVLATSSSLASGDLHAFYREAQLVLVAYPGSHINLSDATGQELINTSRPFGTSLPKRNVSLETTRAVFEGRSHIANIFMGAVNGKLAISVDVPVFHEGRVIYDLAMVVYPDRFAKILSRQQLPPEWLGTMFDSNQIIVARTRLADQFTGRKGSPALLQQMRLNAEGRAEFVNLEGTLMFDSFSRSATSGWTVVIGVPKAIMTAEIWRWLAWTIVCAALFSFAGIALAMVLARRIAGSIQGLIAPALALGRGEPVTVGQFGLAETNAVGDSLIKASELIQQRAAERERSEATRREAEDLKRYAAELERSEAAALGLANELAAVMDAVPAVVLIANDPLCLQMTSNRAGYELLRQPPGSNLSQSASEAERPSRYKLLKDGRLLLPGEMAMQMAAAGHESRDFGYTVAFDDGSSREMFGNAVPLLDEKGHVRGAVGAFIDITERKHMEKQLRATAERLQAILENAPMGIITANRQNRFEETNPAFQRMTGYSAEELQQLEWMALTHPDDIAPNVALAAELVQAHLKSYDFEKRYVLKDGRIIWVRIVGLRLDDDRRISIVEDITERKRTEQALRVSEEQLRQAQKMEAVGRLAGGIAHDFNNLLMVIQSYTEMLQDSLPAHDALRKHTREIMKAAERAASLTGQMLAFSRKQIVSPVVLDLNAVINETAKMLKRLIGEDIDFRVDQAKSLWAIEADPDQVAQVLMNLCVNSRDAMPRGGTLTVTTRNVTVQAGQITGHPSVAPGDYVELSIADTGTGISKDVIEQVFEPFFTTKEVGKGTGLGLAMVYGMVKQCGGYVWVDSEPGLGACFTIYLPRVKTSHAAEMLSNTDANPRGSGVLLVVEDEDALREAMCSYLRSLGYTVFAAGSGQEALAVAGQQEHIDLLITDVVMPKMSGRELSQMLGSLRPELKIIHMSGYTDDAVLRHGIQELGTTFLQKPFSLGTLARKVFDTLQPSGPIH